MRAVENVSELETLLGSSGSRASFGNLVLIPIKQSLLYVRPFYVESNTSAIPELRKVIVYFNDRVVVNDTLQGALADLFGNAPPTQEEPTTPSTPSVNEDTVDQLLAKAVTAFDDAQKALADGNLGTYQQKVNEARGYIQEAQKRNGGSSSSSSSTTTTSTTAPSR
jgi:uncharacterized membrane protein (UPF0182 family)